MGKKRGIAASILRQTEGKAKVFNLGTERRQRFGIVETIDVETGVPRLFVRFAVAGKEPAEVDLTYLTDLPNLGHTLAEGFQEWGATKERNTRFTTQASLKTGFIAYLRQLERIDISIGDIDRPLLVGFIKWLNRPDALDGKPWSIGTRNTCLKAFRAVFEGLRQIPAWSTQAREILDETPQNPWPGRSRKGTPTKRLTREHLVELLTAVESEIEATLAMLEEGRKMLADGRIRLPTIAGTRSDYLDPAVCLAALDATFAGVVPDIPDIIAINPCLGVVVRAPLGHKEMTKYLYPSSRLLVPFVLFLAISTALNAESLLTLEWSDIEEEELFGAPIIRIRAQKARAAEDPVLTLPGASVGRLGIKTVFDTLRTWTARLLPCAEGEYRDRVFMFIQVTGTKYPKSFGARSSASRDITWGNALKAFCQENGIAPFALRQIRPTVLDEVQQFTGDIQAAKHLGHHRDPTTTWTHYTSDGTRQRYKERLGETFLLRARWRESKGNIDPRTRTASQDKGAATPGFLCLDPFDSPQPNQTKGRLCAAYGRCPACPLAAANVSDPACLANYQALRRAIIAAQKTLAPKAWLAQWGPVLQSLDQLLQYPSAHTTSKAASIRTTLPAVG